MRGLRWFVCLAVVGAAAVRAQPSAPQDPYKPMVGQDGKDAVWVPTTEAMVEKMLDHARVTADDLVMDLGSGDGRMIIAAARRGARGLGVEYNPDLVEYAKRQAAAAGVGDKALFVQGDMYQADISKATVLALFLLPSNLEKLVPRFLDLPPGTRIVANTYWVNDWTADDTQTLERDCDNWCTSKLFIIPAKVQGSWRLPDGVLSLTQRYQEFEGTYTPTSGASSRVKGRLRGRAISLTMDGVEYVGTVNGDTIEGTAKGDPARIVATRIAADPSSRFYDLQTITPASVGQLQRAWVFHTGEFAGGQGPNPRGQVHGFQTRPVFADGVLFVTTPSSRVLAVDAENGELRWTFDPQADRARRCEAPHRGVALWERVEADGRAVRTIFSGTCDGRLVALDGVTGRPRPGFGIAGSLDLRPGADARPGEEYAVTSPPAVYRDLVIVGALAPEGAPRGPAGDVRAFDARTGRLVWQFHTVPRPGEPGHETWPKDGWQRRTGVNVWGQMTVDVDRGLVFLPIGSASYDFYGGDRAGHNLYSSSLVALDAATGKRAWHFQLVHHDLWDFDPPAAPILVDLPVGGRRVPAVVQLTKMGIVFAFDRTNGAPLFPIEERRVPSSDVPGETASGTQPFPVRPPPLARHAPLREDELTMVTPESNRECAGMFARVRSGGIYTPPGRELTLWFPGTMGGITWSGGAVDPRSGRLFVNTNEIGAIGSMVEQPPGSAIAYRRASPWGDYARFWDSARLPCQQPPWGQLHAVDLASGTIAWQVPFGDAPQLESRGIAGTGTPNLGGAIVTSTGLVIIAGTNDRRIRAFDAASGRVLWRETLDASGHATPVAYRSPRSGREFIVIAAGGGGRFSTTVSDTVIAFALPGSTSSRH
jgi:glucose dehydrogenase/precorrin-6B methylase 2